MSHLVEVGWVQDPFTSWSRDNFMHSAWFTQARQTGPSGCMRCQYCLTWGVNFVWSHNMSKCISYTIDTQLVNLSIIWSDNLYLHILCPLLHVGTNQFTILWFWPKCMWCQFCLTTQWVKIVSMHYQQRVCLLYYKKLQLQLTFPVHTCYCTSQLQV